MMILETAKLSAGNSSKQGQQQTCTDNEKKQQHENKAFMKTLNENVLTNINVG